ncbi:MAG: ABC transporter ATP-binding protein [Candidatus Electrothrix sp. AU1_5]|nr:ABC transporter ATP-binding protein [Candidatus Electrothrix gigas]
MLLEVEKLRIGPGSGETEIVQQVSFSLDRGQVVGLLGASGSGKTLLAYALCGLLSPPLRITGGTIRFAGITLYPGKRKSIARLRGKHIFMMFQSASSALNPYMTVGKQIAEALVQAHKLAHKFTAKDALHEAGLLLERVGLDAGLVTAYPFQLSGGMQQRVLIAIALGIRPDILIADEPTTGLDAAASFHVLELLRGLQEDGMALLFISHDIRAVSFLAERTGVMCQGQIVESGKTEQLLAAPQHTYTRELIAAMTMIAMTGRAALP